MSMMEKMKKLMAEPVPDESDFDEDYDWDEGEEWEEGLEDYDEEEYAEGGGAEVVEYADQPQQEVQMVPGATMRPLRVLSNAANRQCNVGVHTIEIYTPQFYFDQIHMEEFDARWDRSGPSVIGKYTKGIGQVEARFPSDDEDPVSFAMTTVHRLMERMERQGWNQTANYSLDGKQVYCWNAVGRMDIGSESLIDRSKSMKTFVCDLFERYGNGEADIEGVDMYNACYGGQAAGLCCLNWVESDRWDGRYGLGIATDISDVPSQALFCVGASCAGTMFFPDAPLTHYSLRASCILHRYDFFKPVGWHLMSPLTDGKYSVNVYMECVDMCHNTLKTKMNGLSLIKTCGYNVFHTGGGFHIVKKAYDRMMRCDEASEGVKMTLVEKEKFRQEKLFPTCHLLKVVGPTHTVSSFLNMSSCIMGEWDKALGKTLCVFTYGSGAAATMYQTMFNDLCWMQPLHQYWIDFYREAKHMYMPLAGQLHDFFSGVWMRFGLYPEGRKICGIDPWWYEKDVYYLMEIDSYGRRFYHRGGITAEPMEKKWEMKVDVDEARRVRADWGPIPAKPEEKVKQITFNDIWKDIEMEMLREEEAPETSTLQEAFAKNNESHKIVCKTVQDPASVKSVAHDGERHSYQMVGSWTGFKEPVEMYAASESHFICDVTVGENGFEEFFLIQDGNWERKIGPVVAKSWKSMPCIGPYNSSSQKKWFLDSRFGAPLEDAGSPGDQYRVMFSWSHDTIKQLEWSKTGQKAPFAWGTYHISGSWGPDYEDMKPEGEGKWTKEVTLAKKVVEFYVVRNKDEKQRIYPDVVVDGASNATSNGQSGDPVRGVEEWPEDKIAPVWEIKGSIGDKVLITFYRNPELPDEMDLEWTHAS